MMNLCCVPAVVYAGMNIIFISDHNAYTIGPIQFKIGLQH